MTDLGVELGRRKKVEAITAAMVAAMIQNRMSPTDEQALRKLLDRIPSMTPDDWSAFYTRYMPGRNLKLPSPDCLLMILDHFRARLDEIEAAKLVA